MTPTVEIAGSWFFEEDLAAPLRRELLLAEDEQTLAVVSELGPSLARIQLMTRCKDPGLERTHWGESGPPTLEASMADALNLARSLLGLDGPRDAT